MDMCNSECFVFLQRTGSCTDRMNVRMISLVGISQTVSYRMICAARKAAPCLETTTPNSDSTRMTIPWTKAQKGSRLHSPMVRVIPSNLNGSAPARIQSLANPEEPGLHSRTSSWWLLRTSSSRRATYQCANGSIWPCRWVWQRPRWKYGFRTAGPSGRNRTRARTRAHRQAGAEGERIARATVWGVWVLSARLPLWAICPCTPAIRVTRPEDSSAPPNYPFYRVTRFCHPSCWALRLTERQRFTRRTYKNRTMFFCKGEKQHCPVRQGTGTLVTWSTKTFDRFVLKS